MAAGWDGVQFSALGKSFVLPLLLSPLLAVATGAIVYLVFRFARLRRGITKELCVCVGVEQRVVPMPQPGGLLHAQAVPAITLTADEQAACTQRYAGSFLGINAGQLLNALHFASAGAVSFARGLNDTPKIAALLLVASVFDVRSAMVAVAIAMTIGGILQQHAPCRDRDRASEHPARDAAGNSLDTCGREIGTRPDRGMVLG